MKAKQTQVSAAVAEAVVNKAVRNHGKQLPPGATAKRASNRAKASGKGVTINWAAEGEKDVRSLEAAENAVGLARIEVIQHVRQFAPLGFGMKKKDTDKKVPFSDAAESYFDGAQKYINNHPDKSAQATLRQRLGEVKRVLNAYILWGIDKVDAILTGDGTYHYKIGQLPLRTAPRAAQQPEGGDKTEKVENKTLAEVEKMADKEQRTVFSKFTPREVGNMVAGLTEETFPAMLHAAAVRLIASKDKQWALIGKTLRDLLAAKDIQEASEVAKKAKAA